MAKTTSIQLQLKDTADNALTRSYSFMNPKASNYTLKQFGVALNALTTNTLNNVYRIDKEDITTVTNE